MGFSPSIPCACSSLRFIITWTPPAALPCDFDRVSRAVLVPSLWRESLGRVPMEAMANGIPVVASDRGPLPETLGSAGFVFTIPGRYTAHTVDIPTAREVAPWLAAIEKL